VSTAGEPPMNAIFVKSATGLKLRATSGEKMCGQAGEQERVTVGRRTRDRNRRDLPTTTSLIFNQEAMVEPSGEVLGNDIPNDIGGCKPRTATRCARNDWAILCKRCTREKDQPGRSRW